MTVMVGAAIAVPALAATATGELRAAVYGPAVPDSYLVVLRDSVTTDTVGLAAAAGRLSQRYGGTVGHVYGAALRGFEVRMPEKAAQRLAADPAVAFVEPNQVVSLPPAALAPTPTATGVQVNPPSWGLDRIDQRYLPLDQLYHYPNTGPNVRAYVIDTGIRRTHVDFGGRVEPGYDVIDGLPADDCNGHGTAMAGVIGGRLHGVAKEVRLVPVRVLNCQGSATYAQVIAGVNWVTANAVMPAVALMALGGS
ncbi:MAG TPA: S8 family serine peptidase, partial [Micromonosporaceae bacterium]